MSYTKEETKFKVVNYGHRIWRPTKDTKKTNMVQVLDISPEVVGLTGTIREAQVVQGISSYALDLNQSGPGLKCSWYYGNQLELLEPESPGMGGTIFRLKFEKKWNS